MVYSYMYATLVVYFMSIVVLEDSSAVQEHWYTMTAGNHSPFPCHQTWVLCRQP